MSDFLILVLEQLNNMKKSEEIAMFVRNSRGKEKSAHFPKETFRPFLFLKVKFWNNFMELSVHFGIKTCKIVIRLQDFNQKTTNVNENMWILDGKKS